MFDTHVHADFSVDAKLTIKEIIAYTQEENMGIIITEHLDYSYPTNPLEFVFDPEEYFTKFSPYRKDKLLLGVELGLQYVCHNDNRKVAKKYPFDMIIGSIHVASGMDVYDKKFYAGRTKKESYTDYLNNMLSCVKEYKEYDSLGHIDYICRYSPYTDTNLEINDDNQDIWRSIFMTLIHDEKALEVNTRRFSDKFAVERLRPLYSLYKDLGGKLVTIGSDAHIKKNLAMNFSVAQDFINSFGFTAVYYKNREQKKLEK